MVSIIIVNYKSVKVLRDCLRSIYDSGLKYRFEIIVVNNDENKVTGFRLIKEFPDIILIENENKGFGFGNNIGAQSAKGEYLFFLNPDTILFNNSVNILIDYLEKHKKAGVVAPLLLNADTTPILHQGTRKLTPLRAIFGLSIMNKLFPNNPIANKFWMIGRDKTKIAKVYVVPGSAFIIRSDLFNRINGFDENFFLYFEEFDLCNRVNEKGYDLFIIPEAKVIHLWGKSTKYRKDLDMIFRKSRFYYFKKYYGITIALCIEAILRLNRANLLLIAIFLLAIFLRINNIWKGMPFIGDQAWFYLSARDLVLEGNIPLVGITSSHTWLHQGAYWTYLLAPVLFMSKFNPVSGAYLSIFLDIFGLLVLYKMISKFFTKKLGFYVALLYASSPLIVANARMPYHTSPVPLLVILLLYFLLKWVSGEHKYILAVFLIMSVLYNFNLATVVFWPVIITLIFFGFYKRKSWILKTLNIKYFMLSIVSFVIPMLPILIYDIQNGFPQTVKFTGWFFYKAYNFLRMIPSGNEYSYSQILNFFFESYSRLIFEPNIYVSSVLFMVSIIFIFFRICTNRNNMPLNVITLVNIVSLIGFFISRTPSGAYLPMLLPGLLIIFIYTFDRLLAVNKYMLPIFIGFVIFFNILGIIKSDIHGREFQSLEINSRKIINYAQGRHYNLILQGPGSDFKSSIMNYEYMTWLLGKNPPSKEKKQLKILINSVNDTVELLN